jgi:hypothetical protein
MDSPFQHEKGGENEPPVRPTTISVMEMKNTANINKAFKDWIRGTIGVLSD